MVGPFPVAGWETRPLGPSRGLPLEAPCGLTGPKAEFTPTGYRSK